MKRSEASQLVATLIAAFPHSQVSEATARVYEEDLADLDFAAAIQACTRLRRMGGDFLPSIAKIREATADITLGPRRTGAEAWGDVEDAQRRIGYCGVPQFEDSIVARIVGRNWPEWSKPENGASDRARFIELYEALSKRARLDQVSGIALPPPAKAPSRLVAQRERVKQLQERVGQSMPDMHVGVDMGSGPDKTVVAVRRTPRTAEELDKALEMRQDGGVHRYEPRLQRGRLAP